MAGKGENCPVQQRTSRPLESGRAGVRATQRGGRKEVGSKDAITLPQAMMVPASTVGDIMSETSWAFLNVLVDGEPQAAGD